MKLLAYLFSIYILVLSLMPCSDAENECRSHTGDTQFVQGHDHKADHNDFCSPFCICSCCSTSVNPKFTIFNFTSAKLIGLAIKFPIRDFSFVSNYYGNIWQPPKINT